MTNTSSELSNVSTFRIDSDEVERRIEEAREMRSEYLAAAVADIFTKLKAVFHIGTHKVAGSH